MSTILLQTGSVTLDPNVAGSIVQVFGGALCIWVGWISQSHVKLGLRMERTEIRLGPVLDAMYRNLGAVPLSTNSPTEREAELHGRYGADDERDRMTDQELTELRDFYAREERDPSVSPAIKLTASLRKSSVEGELAARERARRNPRWAWLVNRLWAFKW